MTTYRPGDILPPGYVPPVNPEPVVAPPAPGAPGALVSTAPQGAYIWNPTGGGGGGAYEAAPPAAGPATSNVDAQAQLQNMLNGWGLGSLTDLAWSLLTSGASNDQIIAAIRQTAEYKARFKGMELRKENGLNAISEADYLNLEDQYRQLAQANGILPGSYDPALAIGNDVSPNEFNNRAQLASREIFNEPPQIQQVMLDYYGLKPGEIASYYLKPENALPRLQQMLYSGEIGGEAAQLGYGLSRQAAESVAQAGYTGDTARSGLAQVAAKSGLFDESIADRGQNLTPETGVLAQFGISSDAIKAVQDRAQRRAAIASAGTGGIVTQSGVLGESIAK